MGGGVAGLVCAERLAAAGEVTLFEAGPRLGGHAWTEEVTWEGATHPVDLGFAVYNERTYPRFTRLLARLKVPTRPAPMSFSVSCPRTGLEYCGSSIRQLFAQRRNLVRPKFLRMLRDILRFNRRAPADAANADPCMALGDYLRQARFGGLFVSHYIVPMGAAIWSATASAMLSMPFRFFVQFFQNHGLLGLSTHHPWRTIEGGAARYVEAMLRGMRIETRLRSPVSAVRRSPGGVTLRCQDENLHFDEVVLALSARRALGMLEDADPAERCILGSFPYQRNDAVLHVDETVLPGRRQARASWNYRLADAPTDSVRVTYDVSRIQGLNTRTPLLLTLNDVQRVRPERSLLHVQFEHPVFLPESAEAQQRWDEINGVRRTWFCGAYWRHGFHEDGVWSGERVAEHILAMDTRAAAS